MNSPWARTLFWGDESPDRKISDEFSRNLAVVIGIEHYAHVTPLPNAANDARALADLLREDHGFEITLILDAEATGDKLRAEFQDLGKRLSKGDRLLVYFAGHGIARDGDWGFLVPHDSESNKIESLLSMEDLRRWLSGLPCRHLLVLLDCCFAGTFQWSGKISRQRTRGVTLYREQYRRWVDNRAHQVITSAAFNQEALDSILIEDCEYKLGSRGAAIAEHSPFAYALLQVLGHPDDTGIEPLDTQSGLITAPALSGILQRTVVRLTGGKQHPQTFTLDEFDVGEYLFQLPGSSLILDHAEPLGKVTPWPGLRPYHQRDRRFFFGRDAEAAALVEHVTSHPITVLVGDSGVGKSSLLRAGLGPRLSSMPAENDGAGSAWAILPPMRPGDRPIMRLCAHLRAGLGKHVWQAAGMDGSQLDGEALRRLVATWAEANPNRRLLLIVDQFEDVFRRCCDEAERDSCMALLAELARAGSKHLAIVLALRSDFYPKLSASPLGEVLAGSHVQLLAPDPDELRDVIERPASLFGLFWDPESLPVALISDFGQEIGALALVSMLLHGLSQDVTPQERTLRGYQGDESFLRQQLDRVANKLGEEQQQEALGQLLLRMSEPEEKSSFRGRSVQDNELIFGSADVNAWVQEALDSLIAARLVVASSQDEHAVYQLAHSKLARVISQRYRNEILGLQATTAIPYKIRQELREAAQAWRGPEDAATEPLRGKDEHAETRSARLWHDDPRLPQVEEALWPTGGSQEGLIGRLRWEWRVLFPKLRAPAANGWLNQSEVEFVRLSVKKRAGFRQAALSVAILIFIVLFAFGAYAWCQRGIAATNEQIAKENQFKAERQAAIARARELAIRSQTVLDSDPRLALLLAVEAMTVTQKYPSAAESASAADLLPPATGTSGSALATQWLHVAAADQALIDALARPAGRPLGGRVASLSYLVFSEDGQHLFGESVGHDFKMLYEWDLTRPADSAQESPARSVGYVQSPTLGPPSPRSIQMLLDRYLGRTNSMPANCLPPDLTSPQRFLEDMIADLHPLVGVMAISPNGRWLVGRNTAGVTRLTDLCNPSAPGLDLRTGRAPFAQWWYHGWYTGAKFSIDGQWLLLTDKGVPWGGTGQSLLELWKIGDSLPSEPSLVTAGPNYQYIGWSGTAFSPDGRWLAYSMGDAESPTRTTISYLPLLQKSAMSPKTLTSKEERLRTLIFTGDSRWLVEWRDASIRLWDTESWQSKDLPTIDDSGLRVKSVAVSPGGRWLLAHMSSPWETSNARPSSVDPLNAWWLWDLRTSDPKPRRFPEVITTSPAFGHDDRWLAAQDFEGFVRLWDLDQLAPWPKVLSGHTGEVTTADFSPDGQWLATGSADVTVRFWNMRVPGFPHFTLPGFSDRISGVSFSADGTWLVTGSGDTVALWKMDSISPTSTPTKKLNYPGRGRITSLALSHRGLLIAAGKFNSARIWDVAHPNSAGRPLARLDHNLSWPLIAFSIEDRWLVAIDYFGGYLWDMSDPNRPSNSPIIWGSQKVALSPDGRWSADEIGFGIYATRLAFSSDSRWLVSVIHDLEREKLEIGVLDMYNPQEALRRLPAPVGIGTEPERDALAFSRQGSWLAAAGADNSVLLWNLDWAALIDEARYLAGRN